MELLYSPASAPCRAVMMCIRELRIPVDMREIDMQRKMEHMLPWFIRMNPQHTVPTLNDNGFILWESRAIMQYLVAVYGRPEHDQLYPSADHQRRASIDRLLYFDMGTLSKSIDQHFKPVMNRSGPPKPQKANALKQALDYLDQFIEGDFVVGNQLSLADLSLLATVSRLEAFNYRLQSYTRLFHWMEHLKSVLSYYQLCNRRGLDMLREMIQS